MADTIDDVHDFLSTDDLYEDVLQSLESPLPNCDGFWYLANPDKNSNALLTEIKDFELSPGEEFIFTVVLRTPATPISSFLWSSI